MKLLAVVPLPPPYTGPENASALLLEANHPFDLRVINTNYRRSPEARGTVGVAGIVSLIRIILVLLFQLLSWRPRIVYYSITATRLGWVRDSIVIILSRALGSRPLLHFRGGHFGFFLRDTDPFTRLVVRVCLRLASGAIVQAERLAPMFAGLVRRVYVLPNPAPDFPLAPYPRPRRVLFVGHLSHAKGYTTLLRAVPIVVREVPSAKFVFVGWPKRRETNIFWDATSGKRLVPEDPNEVFWKEIKQNGLEGYLEFYRDLRGEDKIRIFASSRVFVLPSYSEGFSVALAEALSAGLACIITPVGAGPEIISEAREGFFVQPGDHIGLAERIVSLLADDPLSERMGRAARQRAEDFSAHKVRERFWRIVEEASK
ncbi:MAG: glycosyltransferase family 4 protein [candidate division WOR-3 bacterium]